MEKKLRHLIIALFVFGFSLNASASYKLVWEDSFDSFNTTAWQCELGGGGWGNGESQVYTNNSGNISVSNGELHITAKKESNGSYTSARIIGNNKVNLRYGKIEARIKCPWGATGVWPAFWMLGRKVGTSTGWPGCGEIDIMEQMCTSDPSTWNRTLSTFHWNGANGTQHAAYGLSHTFNEQLGARYRIYGIEWTPSQLIGYVCDGDGNNYIQIVAMDIPNNSATGLDTFHQEDNEFFIIFNIALGGSYTNYSIDPNFSSATMLVDWVRVYQDQEKYPGSRLTNNSNLTGGSYDTASFKDTENSFGQNKTYSFDVNYSASEKRELWVSLYKTQNYDLIGETKVVVEEGSGTSKLTINLNNVPEIADDYIAIADIRPINGDWTTRIKQDAKNISIIDSYNYWVIMRDNVSDMDSYLDLRSNEFAEWAGTVSQMVASQYEGDDALAYNVNSAVGSWFGFGVVNTSGSYYFGDLADYGLHFAYKTDYNGPLSVKMGGTNGEFSVEFTPIADNKWHSQEISMSEFIDAGLELGTTTNNLIFSIVSENVVKTNATINVDDIYYYKTDVLSISITDVDIVDVTPLSVYQPNADLLCINGTSKGSQIELIHMNGISIIKTEAIDGTSYLSINSMPSGLYLLRIDSNVIKVLIK